MLRTFFLFLLSLFFVVQSSCTFLPLPASLGSLVNKNTLIPDIGGTVKALAAGDVKLAALKSTLSPLGWDVGVNLLKDSKEIGRYKATQMFGSHSVGIALNLGGEQMVEIKNITLADIDIPFSKDGVIPSMNRTLKRRLKKKGIDKPTLRFLEQNLLQPMFSALKLMQN